MLYSCQTIEDRLFFINLILNGTIKITNRKIDYPFVIEKNDFNIYDLKNKIIPYDILDFFKNNCNYLDKFKGKSSFPFCLFLKHFKIALKISYFTSSTSHFNLELNPSLKNKDIYIKKNKISKKNIPLSINSENIILNLLAELVYKKYTPHINLPILCFKTKLSKLKNNLNNYPSISKVIKEKELLDIVYIYLSEWCNYNNLKDYFDKYNINNNLDIILFQIISTLVIIQELYPSFRHNDLHLKNILVEKLCYIEDTHYLYDYTIEDKHFMFEIKNIGIQIRIWDFDWSSIEGIVHNNKAFKYDLDKKNKSFDLYFFMYVLESYYLKKNSSNLDLKYIHFFKDIRKNIQKEDINQNKKNVLIKDKEYETPLSILKKHSLKNGIFHKFLYKKKNKKDFLDIYKYP